MFGKKFLISLIAYIIFQSNVAAFAAENPFTDLPANHWAYNDVIALTKKAILNGYGDGTFRGKRNITRYEAAVVLAKILGFKPLIDAGKQNLKFTDLPKNHWAYEYVKFSLEKGINKGYDDNTFRGDKYITRYEMAHMLANVLKLNGDSNKANNPFSDMANNHWAVNSVINLASKGIIKGYGDGTFKGNKNITRYEAAHMVAETEALMISGR